MKDFAIKGFITVIFTGAALYFRQLVGPLIVLAVVMIADYITGMAAAWVCRALSSRAGVIGIIKKCGYLFAVAVAIVVDYVIHYAVSGAGIELQGFYAFGLLVTIWLILNECLSILENLSEIGVPLPKFLVAVVKRLKTQTEHKGEAEAAAPEDPPAQDYERTPLSPDAEKWLTSVLDPVPGASKEKTASESNTAVHVSSGHPPEGGRN